MRIFKKEKVFAWVRLIVFLVGIFVINRIFIFFLFPAKMCTRWAGHEIAQADKKYDLLAFGSSELLTCWYSEVADDILGIETCNVGGSASYLESGVYALFRNAMTFQNPRYAVIMVGTTMIYSSDGEHSQGYASMAPYMENKSVRWEYFFNTSANDDDGTIKRFFLWPAYNTIRPGMILENVKARFSKKYKEYDYSFVSDYKGAGFVPHYDSVEGFGKDNMCDRGVDKRENTSFLNEEATIQQCQRDVLDKMIDYCNDNNIKVILLSQPLSISSIYSRGNYYSYSTQLDKYAREKNVIFWDLNLTKSDFIERNLDYFYDWSHVNIDGAKVYTSAVCHLIQMTENGEDVSDLFYTDWEDYINSIDEIVVTYSLLKEEGDKRYLSAYCVTGGKVTPEYQFVIRDADSGEESVLQDYSEENKYIIPDDIEKIKGTIRVYARLKGASDKSEVRYYDYEIN